jgi:hypothetical protein
MNGQNESGYIREELGSIKATVKSIESKVDSHIVLMNASSEKQNARIRKLEDWKLKIMGATIVIGTIVSLGWNWFIRH